MYLFIAFMKLSLIMPFILFILVLGDNTIKYKIEKIIKLFLILILLIMD